MTSSYFSFSKGISEHCESTLYVSRSILFLPIDSLSIIESLSPPANVPVLSLISVTEARLTEVRLSSFFESLLFLEKLLLASSLFLYNLKLLVRNSRIIYCSFTFLLSVCTLSRSWDCVRSASLWTPGLRKAGTTETAASRYTFLTTSPTCELNLGDISRGLSGGRTLIPTPRA
jgi:hypothetical protein